MGWAISNYTDHTKHKGDAKCGRVLVKNPKGVLGQWGIELIFLEKTAYSF